MPFGISLLQRESPLRVSGEEGSPKILPQIIGMGAAIIAAFLTLAVAACFLDLPYFLSFNLFCSVYWFSIYISIYIEFLWGVYERTKDMVKRAFTQAFYFFLQISFLIISFFFFIFFYKQMFPEIEKGNLVNPLQVLAQLSSLLFNFRYPKKPVRVRHLLLLCFFLSLCSSLYLQGIKWEIISLLFFFFFMILCLFPLDYTQKIMFFVYFLEQGLAKWGFFLAFQQVAYCGLSLFLEKEQSGASPKKRLFSFILLLLIQLFFGFDYYGDFYLKNPLNLAALFSGACIIFMSLKKRTKFQFLISFFIYFSISIFIGIISSPSGKTTILGVPHGIFIFIFLHVWLFLGSFFFKGSLPRERQPLVPIFFSGLFFLLCSFPDLAWLEKWIEGIDLLLLFLGIFSLIENSEIKNERRINDDPILRRRRRRKTRHSGEPSTIK